MLKIVHKLFIVVCHIGKLFRYKPVVYFITALFILYPYAIIPSPISFLFVWYVLSVVILPIYWLAFDKFSPFICSCHLFKSPFFKSLRSHAISLSTATCNFLLWRLNLSFYVLFSRSIIRLFKVKFTFKVTFKRRCRNVCVLEKQTPVLVRSKQKNKMYK